MLIQSGVFPPLPKDTARAAEAEFGAGNIYLNIGDQIEFLFADIDLARLDPLGERSASTLAALALVTIFQFAGNLPDRRAVEALRTRLDWKYALHLPLNHPGYSHLALCEFRRRLLHDPAGQPMFQQMLDRIAETGILGDTGQQHAEAERILLAICAVSRLEQLVEAMHAVLEAVAATEPEWLLAVALPHWYERYDQMPTGRALPKSSEEQVSLAQAIGADAQYLLEAIAAAGGKKLALLPEVQALWQVWRQQFSQSLPQIEWRVPFCASCDGACGSLDDLAHPT